MTQTVNNPAGRLHYALSRFNGARSGVRVVQAWQNSLQVDSIEEVYSRLASLGGQITELEDALNVQYPGQLQSFATYRGGDSVPDTRNPHAPGRLDSSTGGRHERAQLAERYFGTPGNRSLEDRP